MKKEINFFKRGYAYGQAVDVDVKIIINNLKISKKIDLKKIQTEIRLRPGHRRNNKKIINNLKNSKKYIKKNQMRIRLRPGRRRR